MPQNTKGQMTGKLPSGPSSSDVRQRMSTIDRVKKQLDSEPKVRIRCMNDEVVYKNGFGVQIKGKEWVEVPESIALILEQAGRI